ncbi:MAG: trypsin-like peptidase domain-containing protein [Candidatus Asgardarchaeia archaeon]
MALITLPNPENYNLHPLPMSSEVKSGGKVYNLGFPDSAQKDVVFSINLSPPSAKFNKGPWIQEGNIISKNPTTTKTIDVNLVNAECLRLNYASESGFSGGPLFSQHNDQVIGMMLMVIPTEDGKPPTESLALSTEEILKVIENN